MKTYIFALLWVCAVATLFTIVPEAFVAVIGGTIMTVIILVIVVGSERRGKASR